MAIDKMIVMNAQAEPELPKADADVHHKTMGSISARIDIYGWVLPGVIDH